MYTGSLGRFDDYLCFNRLSNDEQIWSSHIPKVSFMLLWLNSSLSFNTVGAASDVHRPPWTFLVIIFVLILPPPVKRRTKLAISCPGSLIKVRSWNHFNIG